MTKIKNSPLKHKRGKYKAHRGTDGVLYGEELYHAKFGGSVEDKPVVTEEEPVVIEEEPVSKPKDHRGKPVVTQTGFTYDKTEEEKTKEKQMK